jgi:hypothetical protein
MRIRRVTDQWEVRHIGKNWHIHLGRGLVKQIWRCLVFRKQRDILRKKRNENSSTIS